VILLSSLTESPEVGIYGYVNKCKRGKSADKERKEIRKTLFQKNRQKFGKSAGTFIIF